MAAALVGRGSATAPGTPATVFAYLSRPQHASAWFATVPMEDISGGAPGVGQRWVFRQRGRLVPVEVTEYSPPRRFTWRTTRGTLRDNLAWTVALRSQPEAPASGDVPEAGEGLLPSAPSEPHETQETHENDRGALCVIEVTIELSPGPLGHLLLLLARRRTRVALGERALRAAERASAAISSRSAPGPPRRSHRRLPPGRRKRPRQ